MGCCRDAAVLFCAMARHQGIPTRTCVGSAAYLTEFGPGSHPDHGIVEVWDADESRWRTDWFMIWRHRPRWSCCCGIPEA